MGLHRCSVCHYRHSRSISVDALLVEKGKILLIKRGNDQFKDYWALPGGYMDFDETIEEACLREFREETGVKVKVKQLLGIYSSPSRHPIQNIAVSYIVERVGGEEAAGDDACALAWFRLEKLPEKLAFDHKQMIIDFLKT